MERESSWRFRLAAVCAGFGGMIVLSCQPTLPRGVSWDSSSGEFCWPDGSVALPVGLSFRTVPSDTLAGVFSSPGWGLVIRHDIGGYAGAWASRERAITFRETVVEGRRVWTAKQGWPDGHGGRTLLFAVTFPDSGCANFYFESRRGDPAGLLDRIANSYRPKGAAPKRTADGGKNTCQ